MLRGWAFKITTITKILFTAAELKFTPFLLRTWDQGAIRKIALVNQKQKSASIKTGRNKGCWFYTSKMFVR